MPFYITQTHLLSRRYVLIEDVHNMHCRGICSTHIHPPTQQEELRMKKKVVSKVAHDDYSTALSVNMTALDAFPTLAHKEGMYIRVLGGRERQS